MNESELEKNPGFLGRLRDFASDTVDRLAGVPKSRMAVYGAAGVAAFFANSEMNSNNQAEARTPIDDGSGRVTLVGTVTVKDTLTTKDGNKHTAVTISRETFDPYPDDDYKPTGVYTAINGSIKPSTTKEKGGKFNPLDVNYTLPDAYGCGIPAPSGLTFKYNGNKKLKVSGRPTHKKIFGKKKFEVRARMGITSSPGDEQKVIELRRIADQNGEPDPLSKIERLKLLRVKPNRSATRKYKINMDKCYPISEATAPEYDKYKQLGYEFVPTEIYIEYVAKIRNKKNGLIYESEQRGSFPLNEVRIYNPEAYKTAP
ncbi:hypothetical protein HZB74_01205 [Candidatus Saccharibacteria bacterium]|nr:hypothetical protein [Candidatus Saccharibacteria bacterium]